MVNFLFNLGGFTRPDLGVTLALNKRAGTNRPQPALLERKNKMSEKDSGKGGDMGFIRGEVMLYFMGKQFEYAQESGSQWAREILRGLCCNLDGYFGTTEFVHMFHSHTSEVSDAS